MSDNSYLECGCDAEILPNQNYHFCEQHAPKPGQLRKDHPILSDEFICIRCNKVCHWAVNEEPPYVCVGCWSQQPPATTRSPMRLTLLLAVLCLTLFALSQAGLILGYAHLNNWLFSLSLAVMNLALVVFTSLERRPH